MPLKTEGGLRPARQPLIFYKGGLKQALFRREGGEQSILR